VQALENGCGSALAVAFGDIAPMHHRRFLAVLISRSIPRSYDSMSIVFAIVSVGIGAVK
jgi:hypothetical protein